MSSERADAGACRSQPALQFQGEKQIGELRLSVGGGSTVAPTLPVGIRQVQRGVLVSVGGDSDHAVRDLRQQQVGQGDAGREGADGREVGEVERPQLRTRAPLLEDEKRDA
ncbi:hypothetical protein ACFW2I_27540 [Streptomyces nigra]|uniref:hypothetical protein n=1 Tax=Streptomyces nigra TaxID=1827580 RepID=UPI003691DB81